MKHQHAMCSCVQIAGMFAVRCTRMYLAEDADALGVSSRQVVRCCVVGFHQEHTCMQTETSHLRLGEAVHGWLAASFTLAGSEEDMGTGPHLYVVWSDETKRRPP